MVRAAASEARAHGRAGYVRGAWALCAGMALSAPGAARAQTHDVAARTDAAGGDASASARGASDGGRAAGQDEAAALAAIAQGRTAADAGDYARARELLARAATQGTAATAAQALYFHADVEERARMFREALRLYHASVARDPGGRYASRALARVEYLERHSEGDFAPLAALERVRTSATLASDPDAIAALARDARTFPVGPTRAEARLLVGQAYAGRLHRPADATPVLRELAQDEGATPEMRRLAMELLAEVRERLGQAGAAVGELRALGAPASMVARMRQRARREVLRRAALGVAAAALLAGVLSVALALRAKRGRLLLRAWARPLPLMHLAMLSIGGALLARSYENHDTTPFLVFGAGALAVYLAASAWSVAGSERAWARIGRAVLCGAAVLAVAFLTMHRFDASMLEGIGL